MRYCLLITVLFLLSGCFGARADTAEGGGLLGDEWAQGLDALFLYSYGFCIIIIAACIAVLFWIQIPSLRNWAWIGLTFAVALMSIGIVFSIIKPIIPFIVLGSCLVGAIIGIWYLIANFDTLKQFVHKDKPELSSHALRLVETCEKIPQKS